MKIRLIAQPPFSFSFRKFGSCTIKMAIKQFIAKTSPANLVLNPIMMSIGAKISPTKKSHSLKMLGGRIVQANHLCIQFQSLICLYHKLAL